MTGTTINRAALLPELWRDVYLERVALVLEGNDVNDIDAETHAFNETLRMMRQPQVECSCCECQRRMISDR